MARQRHVTAVLHASLVTPALLVVAQGPQSLQASESLQGQRTLGVSSTTTDHRVG